MNRQSDQRRIAELEAEVARLLARQRHLIGVIDLQQEQLCNLQRTTEPPPSPPLWPDHYVEMEPEEESSAHAE